MSTVGRRCRRSRRHFFVFVLILGMPVITLVSCRFMRGSIELIPKKVLDISHFIVLLARLFKFTMFLSLFSGQISRLFTVVTFISHVCVHDDSLLPFWSVNMFQLCHLWFAKFEVRNILLPGGLLAFRFVQLVHDQVTGVQRCHFFFILCWVVLLGIWSFWLVDFHGAVSLLLCKVEVCLVPLESWTILVLDLTVEACA